MPTREEKDLAPHGRDASGTPLAPYGLNVDGTPRKSNRGARRGQKGNAGKTATKAPAATLSSLSDNDRKGMLCDLADMVVTTPLAGASTIPFIAKRIGRRQADALAGDAFIIAQYMPGMADGLIVLSKTKPGTLAWLDKLENAAPALLFTNALLGMTKALVSNHFNPDPAVAKAGRMMAAMNVRRMADAVNAQAAQAAQAGSFEEMATENGNGGMPEEPTLADFENAGFARATAEVN